MRQAELIGDYFESISTAVRLLERFQDQPDIRELPADIVADIYLRCGSIAGYLGRSKQFTDAQQISRNLLTEALERFIQLGAESKISECENYLALSFERIGDIKNAGGNSLEFGDQPRYCRSIIRSGFIPISSVRF